MQNFKGDAKELKMQAVAGSILDTTDIALDEFYLSGFDCDAFILTLYDDNRMPFSERIPRDAFASFIKQAMSQFPFTGTFESYLFILRGIFGSESEIFFDVPSPGNLEIEVNAVSALEFDFVARELVDSEYVFYNMVDYDDNQLVFRGIAGIETASELELLFSEIMPAGINPDIGLTFYSFFTFLAWDDDGEYDMVDHLDNSIIFREIGG